MINFPTSLDALSNPAPSDPMSSPSHSGQHADANDAIEALEAKVGIDGSAVTTSLDYKVANRQPLDGTLTAFAALTVAANSLTIGTGADAFSQTTFAANTFPARSSSGNLVAKTITDFGLSLVDDADASAARTTLGLVIGTNVQAYDAELAALAGLTSAADKLPYFTGSGTAALADLTSFARSFLDDANGAAVRATIGLGTVATLDSDTDTTLAANSDAKIATQKAVKTYVDNAITGLLDFKGGTDASGNPNYPAASKGDGYIVTVAGKVGGASGKSVDVGDWYVATADNAGGTEASVGTSWAVIEHNIVAAALTKTDDTNVTLTLGGTPANSLLAAASITVGWTGTLAVSRGGTGLGTLTAHALYVGNGTSAPNAVAVGTTNTLLHGVTGADPTFSAVVEADLNLTDLTTADVSASKHGFAPKAPGNTTTFLRGDATWAEPTGLVNRIPTADVTVPDGYSLVVSDNYEIGAAVEVTLAADGNMEIL